MKTDMKQIGRDFARVMADARNVWIDTDGHSQQRSIRQRELNNWSFETGRRIAAGEGIDLDRPRLAVVHCLRDYYLDHGMAHNGRELGDMLDERFADEGGRKYLRRLFPGGPVTQGMKIAGLAVPDYSEDEGFGTAR